MRNWHSKILLALIIFFLGFATAIYALVPGSDNAERVRSTTGETETYSQSDEGFTSERFARTFSSEMRKCISFAEEKSAAACEFVKTKMTERQNKSVE